MVDTNSTILIQLRTTQAQISADQEQLRSLYKRLLETQDAIMRAQPVNWESLEVIERIDDMKPFFSNRLTLTRVALQFRRVSFPR